MKKILLAVAIIAALTIPLDRSVNADGGEKISSAPIVNVVSKPEMPKVTLTGCTLVAGSQWTSTYCSKVGGYLLQYAQQDCWVTWYKFVTQRGNVVGQGGYSSAGPCTTGVIANRKRVDTNSF